MSLSIVLALAVQLAQTPPPSAAGSITGQVVEETTSAPIADAQVSLFAMPRRERGVAPTFDPPLTARTNASGHFQFERIGPGQYQLQVQKAGFARPESSRPVDVIASQTSQLAPITLP